MLSSGDPDKEAEAVKALKYEFAKKGWSVFKQVYSPYRLDCLVQGSDFSEDSKDDLAAKLETYHKLALFYLLCYFISVSPFPLCVIVTELRLELILNFIILMLLQISNLCLHQVCVEMQSTGAVLCACNNS